MLLVYSLYALQDVQLSAEKAQVRQDGWHLKQVGDEKEAEEEEKKLSDDRGEVVDDSEDGET